MLLVSANNRALDRLIVIFLAGFFLVVEVPHPQPVAVPARFERRRIREWWIFTFPGGHAATPIHPVWTRISTIRSEIGAIGVCVTGNLFVSVRLITYVLATLTLGAIFLGNADDVVCILLRILVFKVLAGLRADAIDARAGVQAGIATGAAVVAVRVQVGAGILLRAIDLVGPRANALATLTDL